MPSENPGLFYICSAKNHCGGISLISLDHTLLLRCDIQQGESDSVLAGKRIQLSILFTLPLGGSFFDESSHPLSLIFGGKKQVKVSSLVLQTLLKRDFKSFEHALFC